MAVFYERPNDQTGQKTPFDSKNTRENEGLSGLGTFGGGFSKNPPHEVVL